MERGPVALAAAVRRREVSSEELVRECLARIARLDPELGAFVEVFSDALREARRKDARPSDAPFHGVPIAIKDLNLVRFRRTRFGTRALPALWSPVDDGTVARLRRAGFVIVGKTATSELGVMPITEPDGRPPTRNPHDRARSPGGSSGGAAAAVAAGMVPVAHGSDGGGSIRIPASFCGLVGLKATRGRIPNAFGQEHPELLYTCGALTRTVADATAMLELLGGPCAPAPAGRLRVRVTTDLAILETDAEVRAAVRRVADLLAGLGHAVEDAEAPLATVDEFLPVWQRLFGTMWWIPFSRTQPPTRWVAEGGKRLPSGLASRRHARVLHDARAWLGDADVLLTPTVALPPPLVGEWAALDGEACFHAAARLAVFTAPWNVAGNPALSVPAGRHSLGVPIGVQLVGRHGEEGTLLRVAEEIERGGGGARAVPLTASRPPGPS